MKSLLTAVCLAGVAAVASAAQHWDVPGLRYASARNVLDSRSASAGAGAADSGSAYAALLDRPVHDRHGLRVGAVEDLVIDLGDGSLEYVIVRFDPGMLAANELLALPLEAVTARGGAALSIEADAASLRATAGHPRGEWQAVRTLQQRLRSQH